MDETHVDATLLGVDLKSKAAFGAQEIRQSVTRAVDRSRQVAAWWQVHATDADKTHMLCVTATCGYLLGLMVVERILNGGRRHGR